MLSVSSNKARHSPPSAARGRKHRSPGCCSCEDRGQVKVPSSVLTCNVAILSEDIVHVSHRCEGWRQRALCSANPQRCIHQAHVSTTADAQKCTDQSAYMQEYATTHRRDMHAPNVFANLLPDRPILGPKNTDAPNLANFMKTSQPDFTAGLSWSTRPCFLIIECYKALARHRARATCIPVHVGHRPQNLCAFPSAARREIACDRA